MIRRSWSLFSYLAVTLCVLRTVGRAEEPSPFLRYGFPAGHSPESVAIGDLNEDGRVDLAVANNGSSGNTVSILLGDGSGRFGPPQSVFVGSFPSSIALDDLNRDGHLDLVITNYGANTASVLFGDGEGGFGPVTTFPTGSRPNGLVLEDFDRDGNLDAAVANYDQVPSVGERGISLLLGDGAGGFLPATLLTPGMRTISVRTADLNGDHRPDLIASHPGSGEVSIQLNAESGFDPAGFLLVASPWALAVGDLNRDKNEDLAVGGGGQRIFVFFGDGQGSFSNPTVLQLDFTPASLEIGDLVGDRWPDLVALPFGRGSVDVFPGLGGGNLGDRMIFTAGTYPSAMAIGRIDDDQVSDLVVCNSFSEDVSVILGDEGGLLAIPQFSSGHQPNALAAWDLNRDGNTDLAMTLDDGPLGVSVLLGDGVGGFGAPLRFPSGVLPRSVAVGNIDGDDDPDLVVANAGSDTISVLLGNGDGTFVAFSEVGVGSTPFDVAVRDLDENGRPDIVVAHASSPFLSILKGDGLGGFMTEQNVPVGATQVSVCVADLNVDGSSDFVTGSSTSNGAVTVVMGDGQGGYAPAQHLAVGFAPRSVAVADLNGDARPDIAATLFANDQLAIFWGDGKGGFSMPQFETVGRQPISLAIGNVDAQGGLDIVTADSSDDCLSLLRGDGKGGFSPRLSVQAGHTPRSVVVADLDADGTSDLAAANFGSNSVSSVIGLRALPTGLDRLDGGTPGCVGAHGVSANLPPRVGESQFVVTCTNAPANEVGVGILSLSFDRLRPMSLGGGLTSPVELFAIPSDPSGIGWAPLPLPNLPSMAGSVFHIETFWSWPTCSPSASGLSSSPSLIIHVSPAH